MVMAQSHPDAILHGADEEVPVSVAVQPQDPASSKKNAVANTASAVRKDVIPATLLLLQAALMNFCSSKNDKYFLNGEWLSPNELTLSESGDDLNSNCFLRVETLEQLGLLNKILQSIINKVLFVGLDSEKLSDTTSGSNKELLSSMLQVMVLTEDGFVCFLIRLKKLHLQLKSERIDFKEHHQNLQDCLGYIWQILKTCKACFGVKVIGDVRNLSKNFAWLSSASHDNMFSLEEINCLDIEEFLVKHKLLDKTSKNKLSLLNLLLLTLNYEFAEYKYLELTVRRLKEISNITNKKFDNDILTKDAWLYAFADCVASLLVPMVFAKRCYTSYNTQNLLQALDDCSIGNCCHVESKTSSDSSYPSSNSGPLLLESDNSSESEANSCPQTCVSEFQVEKSSVPKNKQDSKPSTLPPIIMFKDPLCLDEVLHCLKAFLSSRSFRIVLVKNPIKDFIRMNHSNIMCCSVSISQGAEYLELAVLLDDQTCLLFRFPSSNIGRFQNKLIPFLNEHVCFAVSHSEVHNAVKKLLSDKNKPLLGDFVELKIILAANGLIEDTHPMELEELVVVYFGSKVACCFERWRLNEREPKAGCLKERMLIGLSEDQKGLVLCSAVFTISIVNEEAGNIKTLKNLVYVYIRMKYGVDFVKQVLEIFTSVTSLDILIICSDNSKGINFRSIFHGQSVKTIYYSTPAFMLKILAEQNVVPRRMVLIEGNIEIEPHRITTVIKNSELVNQSCVYVVYPPIPEGTSQESVGVFREQFAEAAQGKFAWCIPDNICRPNDFVSINNLRVLNTARKRTLEKSLRELCLSLKLVKWINSSQSFP